MVFTCHGEKSRVKVTLYYVLSKVSELGVTWCGIVGDGSIKLVF